MIILFVLTAAVLLTMCAGYFYHAGWSDCFQDQISKLQQRQALGEMTIQKVDIERLRVTKTVDRVDMEKVKDQSMYEQYVKEAMIHDLSRMIPEYITWTESPAFDSDDIRYDIELKVLKF